jgi:hypothetical protein
MAEFIPTRKQTELARSFSFGDISCQHHYRAEADNLTFKDAEEAGSSIRSERSKNDLDSQTNCREGVTISSQRAALETIGCRKSKEHRRPHEMRIASCMLIDWLHRTGHLTHLAQLCDCQGAAEPRRTLLQDSLISNEIKEATSALGE